MKTEKLKESYSAASLEILLIRAQDVITTSPLDPDGSGESGNLGEWTPLEW